VNWFVYVALIPLFVLGLLILLWLALHVLKVLISAKHEMELESNNPHWSRDLLLASIFVTTGIVPIILLFTQDLLWPALIWVGALLVASHFIGSGNHSRSSKRRSITNLTRNPTKH
jgi:hypothetical protein